MLTCLTQVEHVKREKEIMQFATDHPNLIALAGSMQDTRHLYLVLELAHGVYLFLNLRMVCILRSAS